MSLKVIETGTIRI